MINNYFVSLQISGAVLTESISANSINKQELK